MGNPTSFTSRQTFNNFFELTSSAVSSCFYNALNVPIQVKNSVTTSVELKSFSKMVFNVTFYILENNVLSYNLIFG